MEDMTGTLSEWMNHGACKGMSPAIFYPDRAGGRLPRTNTRTVDDQAKAICATCPVRYECRDWAFNRPETLGTWGGLTDFERARIQGRTRNSRRYNTEPATCGTNRGYNKHRMGHQRPCESCQQAHDDYMAEALRVQATA